MLLKIDTIATGLDVHPKFWSGTSPDFGHFPISNPWLTMFPINDILPKFRFATHPLIFHDVSHPDELQVYGFVLWKHNPY